MSFSKAREGLAQVQHRRWEEVLIYMRQVPFQLIVMPELNRIDAPDQVDARGRKSRRRPRIWTAPELESILIFGRMAGKTTVKDCLSALAADQVARRKLGFTRSRLSDSHVRGDRMIHDCLPSEATMSRHLARWGREERRDAYEALNAALRDELLEIPEVAEDAGLLYMDGTSIETCFMPPKFHPDTGELVNGGKVTAPDAGYVALGNPRSGSGWTLVPVVTRGGVILSMAIGRRNKPETALAAEALADLAANVLPKLPRKVRVLTADSGFSNNGLRKFMHKELDVLPNIHQHSHKDTELTQRNARKESARRIPIESRDGREASFRNWAVNGHRELVCSCGEGRIERQTSLGKRAPQIHTIGRCENCGDISVTPGAYRLAKNPTRFVPAEPGEEADWSLGNPLTYNDPLSLLYGNDRMGRNEGLFGCLSTGLGLLKGKRRFRSQVEAETDVAFCVSILNSRALIAHQEDRRRRTRAPSGAQPPP